ncbi:hypothetical protein CUS_7053 [Ruminococcus albus 8]|uniref:Uncharacterized protein n=1 Tax=Ruminococcus albus 8 TaxID=246199 RepID=E9SHV0_RUMAL|nr:hypothetical protein CUS_7053 [Ruminococcus albus 8]
MLMHFDLSVSVIPMKLSGILQKKNLLNLKVRYAFITSGHYSF